MLLKIISVSQKAPNWILEACKDYQKRFKRPFELELIDVPLAKRSQNSLREKWLDQENLKLRKHFSDEDLVVALDVRGTTLSSEQFAEQLRCWQPHHSRVCFLIGGPDGLDPSCLERAQLRLSLSKMTLAHGLAKVMLVEQLYRAWSLTAGLPYHRGN